MPPLPEIKNLKEFLTPQLDGAEIMDHSIEYLTSIGDNYGSTMLALSLQLRLKNGKLKKLELVAKMSPTNKVMADIFQIHITFVKESCIYLETVPALIELQQEANIPKNEQLDVFPLCYGARTSLDPTSNKVDSDALLLLENLKFKDYFVGERTQGFNKEYTEIILKNLAKFHAVPIALRYRKPEVFEEKVRPYLRKIDIDEGMGDEALMKLKQVLDNELKSVPEILQHFEQLDHIFRICRARQSDLDLCEECPFNTICHNDFWVNNMMIACNTDGQPDRVKIIDFQLTVFDSLAFDVLFFLFTSVENHYLLTNIDNLLKNYHQYFYECLKQNGCPLEDFSYEKFLNEINRVAPLELYHIVAMTKVLLLDNKKFAGKDEMDFDDAFINEEMVGPDYFEKLKLIVLEYDKRNWLKWHN